MMPAWFPPLLEEEAEEDMRRLAGVGVYMKRQQALAVAPQSRHGRLSNRLPN